ncbi:MULTISPECIES: DUF305 domain-containing protein [Deinococcus]|uniref:DUF305 domain-containing protein n=1 Tax=Deinococcus TaxID=1298 RepID=UPI0004837332|nr:MULTISPECIES: DUF305 domain-containing protein [Deinococcus]KEF33941.1 hypothetical protein RDMS_09625 [Deinococcus sp. RL]
MRRVLLLGLVLGASASAQTHGHAGHGGAMTMEAMNAQMLAELRPLKGRAFDVRFSQLMMDHHRMAVDMARAALKSGRDARVRAAAREVIAAQEQELAQLGAWVKAWTGQTYRPAALPLNVPRSGVDRWFLTEMIPHHQGAVQMARLVPARTQNAALRKLSQAIIRTQSAEINQYRAWLGTMK